MIPFFLSPSDFPSLSLSNTPPKYNSLLQTTIYTFKVQFTPPKYNSHLQSTIHTSKLRFTPLNFYNLMNVRSCDTLVKTHSWNYLGGVATFCTPPNTKIT